MTDAVVIGAGPNGLVAANILASRGWSTIVLEEQEEPGGAVKTAPLTEPGYHHDVFSAFYPLAAASPIIRGLGLERWGLEWTHAPAAVAHPSRDGRCALLSRDRDVTAESLESYAKNDGQRWMDFMQTWDRAGEPFIHALLSPFPPVRAGAALLGALGPRGTLEFGRMAALTARRLAEESFNGEGAMNLLVGNALHADLTPDSVGGGLFGWVLCGLGQTVGFPVPRGGAGQLSTALVKRLRAYGGELRCGARASQIEVEQGRAVAVETEDGQRFDADRAVLADVGAPQLYRELVGSEHLPESLNNDLERFQYDNSTVKVDWALAAPIPWTCSDVGLAGTVHIAEGVEGLAAATSQLENRLIPADPFLVMGQYAAADPTRQPEGAETAWAYTHVPQSPEGDAGEDGLTGAWDERETRVFVDRIEAAVEELAPGFKDLITGRHVLMPQDLERANANLVGGAINGGTAQIHQQLVFRPTPGLGRSETPIRGLYLASASAHPGGGVHGGPGSNAARAALAHSRTAGLSSTLLGARRLAARLRPS